jgi:hypothetical protein
MQKAIIYILIATASSFIVSVLLFNGSGGFNSPLVRFGDLLITPLIVLILIDPLQYLWKKYISKKELTPVFSASSAFGILENYFLYWLIFGSLRVAYWIYFDIPHTYVEHLPYWRQ